MAIRTYLPFSDNTTKLVTKGDIIELVTGEKVTFTEMKRTKFFGTMNGKGIAVPVYRNKYTMTPYAKAIVGRDETVITKGISPAKLKFGDLFFLEGHKETFMYVGNKTKRGGRPQVYARDLASTKMFNIDAAMTMVKLNLNAVKKEVEKFKTA